MFDPARWLAAFKHPNVWIPSIFFAMFATMLAANGAMVYVALDSWRGLETDNAYEKGVAYNRTLARQERELALGWDLGVEVATPGARRAEVTVRLADDGGAPLAADRVRVGFVRPTQEGYDRVVELTGQGGGVYTAGVTLPLPGLWELRIAADKGADALHETRRVMVAE